MAQVRVWTFAILLAVCMAGCGGSEYRFGNTRTLPNLSGQWNFSATSQTMSQQYQGTGNFAQTNLGLQGSVNLLNNVCEPTANLSGSLVATPAFNATSLTSYSVSITLQGNVSGGGTQEIILSGSASADGTKMSGTYTVPEGVCSSADAGAWTASKN